MSNNFLPVLEQNFFPDLVCMNVVASKTLHAEVIDKSVSLNNINLRLDLLVWNFDRDETKSDAESIALEISKIGLLENSFEWAYFDLRVPVFAPLLSD